MAFCEKCGTQLEEGVKFCPSCGAEVSAAASVNNQPQNPVQPQQAGFGAKVAALNDTADTTATFDPQDISGNKAMGILAYLGLLCLIPIFAAKGSKFARFHANQGLILLIASVAWSIVSNILNAILLAISYRLYFLTAVISFLSIVFVVLAVIGIVNAASGRAKELPVIGKFQLLK